MLSGFANAAPPRLRIPMSGDLTTRGGTPELPAVILRKPLPMRNANDDRTPHLVGAVAALAILSGAILLLDRPPLGLALIAAGAFAWFLRRELPRPALRRVRTPPPGRWHRHAKDEIAVQGSAFHQPELQWLRRNAGNQGVIVVFVPLPQGSPERDAVRVDSHGVTIGQLEITSARRYRARYGEEVTAARVSLVGDEPIAILVE